MTCWAINKHSNPQKPRRMSRSKNSRRGNPKRRNYCCEWCSHGGTEVWRSVRAARRGQLSNHNAVVQLDDLYLTRVEVQKAKSKVRWLRPLD